MNNKYKYSNNSYGTFYAPRSSSQLTDPTQVAPPLQTNTKYANFLDQFNTLSKYGVIFFASLANGSIYFAPAQHGFKNTFDQHLPWSIEFFYLGGSAFIANTLLSFSSINSLISFKNPIPYKEDISSLSELVIEIPINFLKNLKANFINIIMRGLLTLACLLVIIPFSIEGMPRPENAAGILKFTLFIVSNLVGAAIYAQAWAAIFEELCQKTNKLSFDMSYADSLAQSLSAAQYKKEFILAYNQTLLAPYIEQMRKHLLKLAAKISQVPDKDSVPTLDPQLEQIYYSLQKCQTYKEYNSKIRAIPLFKNIPKSMLSILIDAYSLSPQLLKEYMVVHGKNMRKVIGAKKNISSIELITLYAENQAIHLNEYFIDLLLEHYIEMVDEKLTQAANNLPTKYSKGNYFRVKRDSESIRLLKTSANFEVCLNHFEKLAQEQQREVVYHLCANNYFAHQQALGKLSKATFLFTKAMLLTFTASSACAIIAAGYLTSKMMLNQVGINNKIAMLSLAAFLGLVAVLGRLGIFITSGIQLANASQSFVQNTRRQFKEDLIDIYSKLYINNNFKKLPNILGSIGYLAIEFICNLICTIIIAASAFGYAGVCKKEFENFIADFHSFNGEPLDNIFHSISYFIAAIAYGGSLLVNILPAFELVSYSLQVAQQIPEKNILGWFNYDKANYWQLLKQISAISASQDKQITEDNDSELTEQESLYYSMSPA